MQPITALVAVIAGRWLSACAVIFVLVEEGFDLGIRIGRLSDSALTVRRLGEIRSVVVASSGWLERAGEVLAPRQMSGEEVIQFGVSGTKAK